MLLRKTTLLAAALSLACVAMQATAEDAAIKGVAKWAMKKTKKGKKLDTGADPYCAQMYSEKPLRSEKLEFNENKTLKHIFVYVSDGLPDKTWPVPAEPVLLDQKGCHYEPHVFGVMAGQEILIRNSDDTAHNINASPKNSQAFNQGQPKKGMEFLKKFDAPELMVTVKCDVHPWMSAYAGVMEHPFFAVTDDDGAFEIKGLPAGTYTLSTWHESKRIMTEDIEVTVGAGETKEVELTFKPKKKKKG